MRCPVCRAVEEGVWRSFPTRAPRGGRAAGAGAAQEDVPEPAVRMQPQSGIYRYLDHGWSSGSQSLGIGGPIRHPHLFQRRHRETAHMMMGSVNGSGWASASSHVTRITHLHLGVNRGPNYGYSFQGNVGPNEYHGPFPQGTSSIRRVGPEAPDIAFFGEPIFNNSAGSLFGPLAGAAPVEQSLNLPSPPVCAMMHAANNLSNSSGLLPAERAFQSERSRTVNIQLPDIGEVVLALSVGVQPGDVVDLPEDIMSDGEESTEVPSE